MAAKPKRVASPCTGVCVLNSDELCSGCQRTPEEIGGWGAMSDQERRDVLRRVEQRRSSAR